jgi:hypothetical protein
VTIIGVDFTGATGVAFGANAATTFTVDSPTQITATAPAGSGVVDVTVTPPGGTSVTSSGDEFTYADGPTVTSITPNVGPTLGGTSVTISGTDFTAGIAVSFGTVPAASVTFGSNTSITAVSPKHAAGGVDVTVTTAGGTSPISSKDRFTFVSASLCATFDLSQLPTTWVEHLSQTVTVTATNCGVKTWPSTGYTRVDLGLHFTTWTGGSPKRSYWKTSVQIHITRNVAPNGSITLRFALTPTFHGKAYLEALMRQEHVAWFDKVTHSPRQYQYVGVTVAQPVLCATFDLSGVPTSWVKGHSQTFSVSVTNCGNVKWPVPGYAAVYVNMHFTTMRGGSTKRAYWLNSLSRRPSGYVLPGDTVIVTFTMTPTFYGHVYLEAGNFVQNYFWFDRVRSSPPQFASVYVAVRKA